MVTTFAVPALTGMMSMLFTFTGRGGPFINLPVS